MMLTILLPRTPKMQEKRLLARTMMRSLRNGLPPTRLSIREKRPMRKTRRKRRWTRRPDVGWNFVTAWPR
jgi:hypothetical protein